MNKNTILGGLLALQVVVALLFMLGEDKLQGHAGIETLLEFAPEKLDTIRIQDAEGNVAEILREDDKWITNENFPLETDRVDRLLEDLAGLDHGLAVASSASAAKRFKVDEKDFERHVQLLQEGRTVADFYLGSGAGARRNHIRLADEEAIFSAALAPYSVPAEIGDWQDKEQLQVEIGQIHAVQVDGLNIRRIAADPAAQDGQADDSEPGWFAESLEEGESLDLETFQDQLENLARIRYNRAFRGSVEEAAADATSPVREITISYGDKSRTYQFYSANAEDLFVLRVSDREELFEISQYNGNQITENMRADKIVRKPEPEQDAAQEDSSTGSTTANDTENAVPENPGT